MENSNRRVRGEVPKTTILACLTQAVLSACGGTHQRSHTSCRNQRNQVVERVPLRGTWLVYGFLPKSIFARLGVGLNSRLTLEEGLVALARAMQAGKEQLTVQITGEQEEQRFLRRDTGDHIALVSRGGGPARPLLR